MPQITWKNVDAPSTAEALKGIELSNVLLNKAVADAQGGLQDIKNLNQDLANRAIVGRMNAITDPVAYQEAMARGEIIGPDAANASVEMLQRAASNQTDVTQRVSGLERLQQDQYTNDLNRGYDAADTLFGKSYPQIVAEARKGNTNYINEIPKLPGWDGMSFERQQAVLNQFKTMAADFQKFDSDAIGLATSKKQQEWNSEFAKLYNQARSSSSDPKGVGDLFMQSFTNGMDPEKAMYFNDRLRGMGINTGYTQLTARPTPTEYPSDSTDTSKLTLLNSGKVTRHLDDDIITVDDYIKNGVSRYAVDGQSSALGIYGITAGTFEEFGKDLRNANIRDFSTQDTIARRIFESTKGDPNKLWNPQTKDGRFRSLEKFTSEERAQIAKMPWETARQFIAAGESSTTFGALDDLSAGETARTNARKFQSTLDELNKQVALDSVNSGISESDYTTLIKDDRPVIDVAKEEIAKKDSVFAGIGVPRMQQLVQTAMNASKSKDGRYGITPAIALKLVERSLTEDNWAPNAGESLDSNFFSDSTRWNLVTNALEARVNSFLGSNPGLTMDNRRKIAGDRDNLATLDAEYKQAMLNYRSSSDEMVRTGNVKLAGQVEKDRAALKRATERRDAALALLTNTQVVPPVIKDPAKTLKEDAKPTPSQTRSTFGVEETLRRAAERNK